MSRTVLITGATGSVSSALREHLRGTDLEVRALVRDPAKAEVLQAEGVQVAIGDLDDPRSLSPAFDGAHDLWLLVPNGPRAPENSSNAIWAAQQAGVERVIRLSAVRASHEAPTRGGRLHALSDRELEASGLRYTILRPHWFMQNLLNEADDIAIRGSFRLNAGHGRIGMIDVRDVAEMAARIITDDSAQHDGKTYTPTGPEPLTLTDVAERFTDVLGTPVDYEPVTDDAQRRRLLKLGIPPWITDLIVEYCLAYSRGWGDFTTRDFLDVVGHPPRDIGSFIRDHAATFRRQH